jgi:hypothetical protein
LTMLRGRVIAADGRLIGNLGDGRLITSRTIESAVLNRPTC